MVEISWPIYKGGGGGRYQGQCLKNVGGGVFGR